MDQVTIRYAADRVIAILENWLVRPESNAGTAAIRHSDHVEVTEEAKRTVRESILPELRSADDSRFPSVLSKWSNRIANTTAFKTGFETNWPHVAEMVSLGAHYVVSGGVLYERGK